MIEKNKMGALRSWAPDGRTLKVDVAVIDASYFDGYADVKKKGPYEGAVSLSVSRTGS